MSISARRWLSERERERDNELFLNIETGESVSIHQSDLALERLSKRAIPNCLPGVNLQFDDYNRQLSELDTS